MTNWMIAPELVQAIVKGVVAGYGLACLAGV